MYPPCLRKYKNPDPFFIPNGEERKVVEKRVSNLVDWSDQFEA